MYLNLYIYIYLGAGLILISLTLLIIAGYLDRKLTQIIIIIKNKRSFKLHSSKIIFDSKILESQLDNFSTFIYELILIKLSLNIMNFSSHKYK